MKACRPHNPTGARNAALLAMLYRSGCRISEALELRLVDVDVHEATIRIRRAKGGKGRTVPIDADCVAVLERWLVHRRALKARRIDPLFCTLGVRTMASRDVRELMPRLAKRANIDRRVHAHAFRHTFATELVREGVPMVQVCKLLGHRSVQTTAEYLATLVTPRELLAVARARAPWAD